MSERALSSRRAPPSSPRSPKDDEADGGGGGTPFAETDGDGSKTRNRGSFGARISRLFSCRMRPRGRCCLSFTLLVIFFVALFYLPGIRRDECEGPYHFLARMGVFGGSMDGIVSDFGILGVPWCRSKHGKTVEWGPKDLLKGLEDFVPIYETRPIKNNMYGMGFDHSFGLWFMARWLKPVLMVESGAFKGHSTWVLRQAMPETPIISLSPRHPEKYLKKGPAYVDGNCTYFAGKDFIDFGRINWGKVLEKHGVLDVSQVLVFFDDHQNQLKRVNQALKVGFQHLIFEDNYDTGTGDHYSLRQICDQFYIRGGGHSCFRDGDEARIRKRRRKMWEKAVDIEELCGNREHWWGVRGEMCDDFNHSNKAISYVEHFKNSRFVESLLDAYWELPPVAGPSLTHQTRYDPARTSSPIVEDGQYSLFKRLGLTGLDASVFNGYTQMVYVKISAPNS
ncbi:hypothetical protein AXF42_Ash000269 [Apostasia shenzhenica]|uniref:Uncharacterized protein n=1 Tax=Apostasia shenzhenica TaxID=1088818 RepID=A0A2I0AG18_9ASPA|nr:hypothetical protein AXF42_Ash000269 [Apostasia shenzhenica]